jgi:hypothetical protein
MADIHVTEDRIIPFIRDLYTRLLALESVLSETEDLKAAYAAALPIARKRVESTFAESTFNRQNNPSLLKELVQRLPNLK